VVFILVKVFAKTSVKMVAMAKEVHQGGRLSTADLLIKLACFVTMINNILSIRQVI
jgi:hypothetical protein